VNHADLLAEYERDYISILKRDRKIKTDSFQEEKINDKSYWCFSINVTVTDA